MSKRIYHLANALVGMLTMMDVAASPWELSVNLGAAHYQMGSSSYQITTTETDTLGQTSNPWVGEIGAGLSHLIPRTPLWLGINYRYTSHDIFRTHTTGQVYQYQEPEMNNYTYQLAATNHRVMLDLALPVALTQKTSLFALGGVGYGRTSLKYKDEPNEGIQGGNLVLNTNYKSAVIPEVGAGLLYQHTNNIKISLQYLYTWLGSMATGTENLPGMYPAELISPARFSLNNGSVLVGFHFAIS